MAGALALSACGRKAKPAPTDAAAKADQPERGTLEWAVDGDWRPASDRKRDADRHRYVAANLETPNPDDSAANEVVAAYKKMITDKPDLYGKVEFTAFGPHSGPLVPDGAADMVLFFNVNNWMAAGLAEKAFRDAYAALRNGGVLGVEQARAPVGGPQDPLAASGYVQADYVKQLAAEARFRYDGASEINANPKDTRDHPFGVWTLPPTRRSSPWGKPPNPAFDHSRYDAIGEPDRMTLRFLKP